MSTVGYLDGVPFTRKSGPTWQMTTGVTPYVGTFEVVTPDAEKLVGNAVRNGSTLILNGHEWKNLSILYHKPGRNPHVKLVVVADRRIWWSWRHIYIALNMARRTGTARRVDWDPAKKMQLEAVPTLDYKPYSVKPSGLPRDPLEAMKVVINRADPGQVPIFDDAVNDRLITLLNIPMDMDGAAAVGLLLRHMGGFDITVAPTGRIHVFNWLSRKESEVVGTNDLPVGPPFWDKGIAGEIDSHLFTPSGYEILFTPETEIRFDFTTQEPDGAAETASDAEGVAIPRLMDNVGPVSDYSLNTKPTDPDNGQVVVTGTYLTMKQHIDAYKGTQGGVAGRSLSFGMLNRAFVPFNREALWNWAKVNVSGGGGAAPEVWSARIRMFNTWYLQGFRLPRQWNDHALAWRPYLVSTKDLTSGQRSKALAWGHYSYYYSAKGLWGSGDADTLPWGRAVDSYPGSPDDKVDANATPIPGDVVVADEDQGIIRFSVDTDPFGGESMVHMGKVKNMPQWDGEDDGAISMNAMEERGTYPKLPQIDATFKLCVLLTGVPANVLFRVRVASKALGFSGGGPVKQIRIREETARIAWFDNAEHRKALETAWGLDGKNDLDAQQQAMDLLAEACVNLDSADALAANLTQMAKAAALEDLHRNAPRLGGGGIYDMNKSAAELHCHGSIETITHRIRPDGVAESQISLRETLPHINLLAYYDPALQQILLRNPR